MRIVSIFLATLLSTMLSTITTTAVSSAVSSMHLSGMTGRALVRSTGSARNIDPVAAGVAYNCLLVLGHRYLLLLLRYLHGYCSETSAGWHVHSDCRGQSHTVQWTDLDNISFESVCALIRGIVSIAMPSHDVAPEYRDHRKAPRGTVPRDLRKHP